MQASDWASGLGTRLGVVWAAGWGMMALTDAETWEFASFGGRELCVLRRTLTSVVHDIPLCGFCYGKRSSGVLGDGEPPRDTESIGGSLVFSSPFAIGTGAVAGTW
ncbi:hypothetical protein LZ30DRAFT_710779 [Colletotrichum cereale]|nr:hypothetical protein LZ30DRAFT_710779 [Colletotrichum cereale]